MNACRLIFAAGVALLLTAPVAQAERAGWTFTIKQTMATACRDGILQNAIRDFAARRNIAVGDLPEDFRPKVAAAMEPILQACDCITEKVSARWDYADYQMNEAKYRPEVQAVMRGECAPPNEVRR